MCLGRSDFNMFICMFQTLSMCPCSLHGQDWGSPAHLGFKYVFVVASTNTDKIPDQTISNTMFRISFYVDTLHVTCRPLCSGGLQTIPLKHGFENA